MAIFEIEWKPSAIKELRRLDKTIISRIVQSVEGLSSNPLPSGVRKLRGGEHSDRIRVGNYRIVYTFIKKQSVLQIARIRHWYFLFEFIRELKQGQRQTKHLINTPTPAC